jgi:hypothetical protein
MIDTFVANLRRLPVACLFALVLLLVVPGMALAGQWSAPLDLPAGSQGANGTVIDADGVVTMIWSQEATTDGCSSRTSAVGCEVRVARLGGAAWGAPITLSTADAYYAGSRLVVDADGIVTALWVQTDGTTNGHSIWSSRFKDDAWSGAQQLSVGSPLIYYTQLGVNAAGSVVAAWDNSTASETQAAQFANGSWTTAVAIPTGGRTSSYIDALVASPDGSFTALLRQTTGDRIGAARLAGGVWTDQGLISPAGRAAYAGAAVVDADGVVTAAWSSLTSGHYVVESTRRIGSAWSVPEAVSTTPDHAQGPQLVIGASGVVTMVWDVWNSSFSIAHLQFTRATGGTWSTPTNIASLTMPATALSLTLDQTSTPFLLVNVSASGSWLANSLHYADGSWSTPQPVVPGVVWSGSSFAINSFGSGVAMGYDRTGTPTVYQSARFGTAPTAPTAVKGTAGSSEIVAEWTASARSSAPPVSFYTATAAPGGGTCIATSSTRCTITSLKAGTEYRITVTATNLFGTSAASLPSGVIVVQASPAASIAKRRIAATSSGSGVTVRVPVSVPGPGEVTLIGRTTATGGSTRSAVNNVVWRCTVTATFVKAGSRVLSCNLRARARQQLRRGSMRFAFATVYVPTGGLPVRSVTAATIARHR